MPTPGTEDVQLSTGESAEELMNGADPDDVIFARASVEDVLEGLSQIDYPMDRVKLVKGCVEETLAAAAPDRVALLHLDTDFYSSTEMELHQLFDRVSVGGVIIIDDYGSWAGARRAVDEFFDSREESPFLMRAGDSRVIVKCR